MYYQSTVTYGTPLPFPPSSSVFLLLCFYSLFARMVTWELTAADVVQLAEALKDNTCVTLLE